VFCDSWIGVGLGVRWVVCTVNCGGTYCLHYINDDPSYRWFSIVWYEGSHDT